MNEMISLTQTSSIVENEEKNKFMCEIEVILGIIGGKDVIFCEVRLYKKVNEH